MNKKFNPFKNDIFPKFIKIIGWDTIEDWSYFCEKNEFISMIESFKGNNFKEDWIWGILLPLLSQSYKICSSDKKRQIIGISALPGTGKSTLGLFLEKLSLKLNIKIKSISIDDFYLPKEEMVLAVKDNPWNVSRGFPGSHSTDLMKKKLYIWKETGELNVPIYDKSLNKGLGDRSYWINDRPDLVVIEGWFLGVRPFNIEIDENENEKIYPPLSSKEKAYRLKIQNNLKEYIDIWKLVDMVWHLKPEKFNYLNLWKRQQEKDMLLKKGVCLSEENLVNFLRMLNTAIPQHSFDKIKSNFLFTIDQERKLINLTSN